MKGIKGTFRGKNTYKSRPEDFETNTGKSETIQDDSYTVIQIIERHQQGLPLSNLQGIWGEEEENADFDSPDLEEVNRMDLNERFQVHAEHAERVSRAKKAIREAEDKAKEKKPVEGV